ncbi:hypothetical protein [Escherichia coli]|uniref:hypothetical protein n=1 Tax=Escherichia coli TaxID=562 RepID=UPI0015D4ABC8|nr:hypothetical protein [Escherichia coli]EER7558096.1 hypothetical protein [Escherichia coli]EEU3190305.1 hypothetical protein [Escherichia coli]EJD4214363.1 hypothetical protein [Escherichia coli]EKV5484748.1 hypothetical protein [Escherichia coli]HAJ7190930.1 hypothetical protein [Escherichia coli]
MAYDYFDALNQHADEHGFLINLYLDLAKAALKREDPDVAGKLIERSEALAREKDAILEEMKVYVEALKAAHINS